MNAEPHAELTVEMALLTNVLLSVPEVEFDAEDRVERRREEHLEQVGVDVEGRLRRVSVRVRVRAPQSNESCLQQDGRRTTR
jgi:hypothetical protein